MPARLLLRSAGTVVLGLLATLAGCNRGAGGNDEAPQVLQLDSGTITLPDSVRLVTVELGRGRGGELEPASITVRVHDVVRFEARDAGAHAVGFSGDGLTPEARRYLEVTGQMRSPPLLDAGNAWVVSFHDAPPGDYPYTCATHGARGRIVVQPR